MTLVTVSLWSCQGCNEQDAPEVTEKRAKKENPDRVIRIDEPYLSNLEKNAAAYFTSNAEGNYEEFINYAYPGVFDEEMSREATIELLQSYRDAGLTQVVNKFTVKHVSELVEDKDNLVCMMIANVEHDIILSGKYAEKPQSLEVFVRDKYGKNNFTYNDQEKTYHVKGDVNLYGITPKDSLHFTFLNDQYVNSPKLAGLLEYNTVEKLRLFVTEVY